MPTKKKAGRKSRAISAARTVSRRMRSAPRSFHSKARSAVSKPHWLTAGLFFLSGYVLKPAVEATGLLQLAYNRFPQYRQFIDAVGPVDAAHGGQWGSSVITKTAGLGLFLDALNKSRKSGKFSPAVMNAELPLAAGILLDPPTAGLPSSGGSTEFWTAY